MIVHGIQAVVLGLSVGLILWIIRKHAPGSRLKLWVLIAGFAGATYLVMKIVGVSGESTYSRIVLSATILLTCNTILQVLNLLFWDYLLKKQGDIHIPRLVIDMINFVILAIVAVAILNGIFGVKLTAFLVTSTVLSAVIGLSLQDILGNLFAGLALQMERPYKVGEWIGVGGEEGRIVQMNWRTLTIRTRSGDHVTIPNATISKEIVTNFMKPDRLHMCRIKIGMAYSHKPGEVKSVIGDVFSMTDGVLKAPRPQIFLDEFDDYAINYDLRFWIRDYAGKPQIENEVRSRIWYALFRAGMAVPFPVREVTVRTVPEDQESRMKSLQREEVTRELRNLEIFNPLSDDQIIGLAKSTRKYLYSESEVLVRQGDSGDSLLIISSGGVEVVVADGFGRDAHVAYLGPGDYFGEMSLLTGEPRSASVIATKETEVIVVEKGGLGELLETESSILEPMSEMLEQRLASLSSSISDREAEEELLKQPVRKEHLLNRIRDFFGIR